VEREALRAQSTELLQRLRSDPNVPQELFELLDNFCRRLDRIEMGSFATEDEIPTRPDRHPSVGAMSAVKQPDALSGRIAEIFSDAKKK